MLLVPWKVWSHVLLCSKVESEIRSKWRKCVVEISKGRIAMDVRSHQGGETSTTALDKA